MDASSRLLFFHAVIILLISLLAGFPYGRAILSKKPPSLVHAWRVAHGSLAVGAALMMALAAVLSGLKVSETIHLIIAWLYIISGYGFAFALILGPLVGARGLHAKGPLSAKAIYGGNVVGAVTSLGGTLLLLYAAFVSLG